MEYTTFEIAFAEELGVTPELVRQTGDPHKLRASIMYGIPVEQVTPEQRRNAKEANFYVLYRGSPKTLVKSTNAIIQADEAEKIFNDIIAYLKEKGFDFDPTHSRMTITGRTKKEKG